MGSHTDDRGEKRRGDFAPRKRYHVGVVDEEGFSISIRDGAQNTLLPRMASRRKEHLKKGCFSCTEFDHGADNTGQRIGLKTLEARERAHEFFREAEFNNG